MKPTKVKLLSVLIGTSMLMMSASVVSNSTTYFITSVTAFLNCNRAEFSLYYTVLQFCTAGMSVLMCSVMRRFPLRLIFIAGAIGTGAGFVVMSNLQSLMMVYVGAAIIGIFQTLVVVPVVSVVNSWFHEHNGLAIGITMSATGIGGIVMAQIMPRVVAGVDWRTGYLVCAALFVTITVIALILSGGSPPKSDGDSVDSLPGEKERGKDEYDKTIRSPMFWVLILCCLLGDGAAMNGQHLSAHLEAQSLSVSLIAAVMSVWSLALAAWKIVEGYLYGRLGSKFFLPILFAIAVFAYLLLITSSMATLMIGIVFFGLAGAMITAVYPLILREIYGPELASELWGFCWAGIACGNSLFTPIIGALYDATGSYNAGYYMSATTTLLVGIIFISRLTVARKRKMLDNR